MLSLFSNIFLEKFDFFSGSCFLAEFFSGWFPVFDNETYFIWYCFFGFFVKHGFYFKLVIFPCLIFNNFTF